MEDSKIEELARAGGLCQLCGGVHQPLIEHSLLATLIGLPLCECEDCRICERVRRAIEALEEEGGEKWQQTP